MIENNKKLFKIKKNPPTNSLTGIDFLVEEAFIDGIASMER